MRVQKRDGSFEDVSFDKVLRRIRTFCHDLKGVDADTLAQQVCSRIYDGVETSKLDELAAMICSSMLTDNPDYGILSARIAISNHQKATSPSFSETMYLLYHHKDIHGKHSPLISDELWEIVKTHKEKINSVLDYDRDFYFDYFGFKTLERSYLMRVKGKVVERPQHMLMRVALGIHGWDWKDAIQTYEFMSQKFFIHATPTLFNAGSRHPQLASCFLGVIPEDSITGIYKNLSDCAEISRLAGGIGISIHNIRGKGSHIRGTNGVSSGIVPMLRVHNETAKYVNQCFTGDTIVYGRNGMKKMETVQPGDELVTIDGTFKTVLGIARNPIDKDILRIRPYYSVEPVQVTAEHEIYTLQGLSEVMNIETVKKHVLDGTVKPHFTNASSLSTNDFIGFPIPTEVYDVKEKDEAFFRLFGILLGNGYITKNKESHMVEMGLSLTDKHESTIGFVVQYLSQTDIRFRIHYDKVNHLYTIRWVQSKALDVSYSDLYDAQRQKHLPAKYLHLPESKTLALLHGLLETDGGYDKYIYFHNASQNLVYNVRYLLIRLGILTYGSVKKYRATSTTTPPVSYYDLRIPKHPKLRAIYGDRISYTSSLNYFVHEGIMWSRIRHMDWVHYTGSVYDFNMEDNHNYLTDMGLVHNSGRRNGSIAVYMEPWHCDIESFIELRKNHGNEDERCRDLFTAMWIPDLFMKRVQANDMWSLMCPDECPNLHNTFGDEFEELYTKYEAEGRFRRRVKAQDIWIAILKSQIETGTPYILFKDSVNRKNNQSNVGVIKSSNLCVAPETQIMTREGYRRIDELQDQEVEVWNGEDWSQVTIQKTNDSAKLIRVTVNDGSYLDCTPYHKFYVKKDGKIEMVEAGKLEPGAILIQWSHPDDNIHFKHTVLSIEDLGRTDATYCFNEPKRHMGVFNGILTGNCTEIMEYTDAKEWAVCNLGSIALATFVKIDPVTKKPTYDFAKLHEIAGILTKNLNKVIDRTYYPIKETKHSNLRHRPIGLGVQGLADAYVLMRMPFDSPEAAALNKQIFETIYHGALSASVAISKKRDLLRQELDTTTDEKRLNEIRQHLNLTEAEEELTEYRGAYSTFKGSPASKGKLQYDLWGVVPSSLWDWELLKKEIQTFGLRNSLLVAPMPTASTSQILGFNEAFEPFTSNLYQRRTLAGEFIVVNKYLIKDLLELGLWNKEMKNRILLGNGSIQDISEIPEEIRALYKNAYELKQKVLIDQSADRGAFICQSQSLNLFVEDPDYSKLTNMHFYSWKKGLKTGMYYLRTRPKASMSTFTISKSPPKKKVDEIPEGAVCRMEEGCLMCSG